MRVAIVFPGQGTQSPGMGRPWRAHPAWDVVEEAEQAIGEHLAPLLLEADAESLAPTREAQLAVLLCSLIAWRAVDDADVVEEAGVAGGEVVAFAGHSLGQVSALVAAGVLTLADAVRFTARRGEATARAARREPGLMAALLGATSAQAETACSGRDCWIANDNAPGQVVVAGRPPAVEETIEAAAALGVRRARLLDVAGAFHTPLMAGACDEIREALAPVGFGRPVRPVVANADARPHGDGEGWRHRLVDHVVSPVRWRESMDSLVDLGAEAFVEVGHGGMIAGLAKRAERPVPAVGIAAPCDVEQVRTLVPAPTELPGEPAGAVGR